MDQDAEHLRLLSIFHYVVGGLTALCACIPIIHLAIGLAILFGAFPHNNGPPAVVGLLMVVIAGCFILAGWALAICLFIAGGYLKSRKHYTFCLVIAGISCMLFPFGTALGVFTIIVLMRPSVKEMFDASGENAPAV